MMKRGKGDTRRGSEEMRLEGEKSAKELQRQSIESNDDMAEKKK